MAPDAGRVRYALLIVPFVLLAVFVATFDPYVNRWLVNFAWLGALLSWALGISMGEAPARSRGARTKHLWTFLVFGCAFAAVWLPFYDNWRWAQAGDTFPWFWVPAAAARQGLSKSFLSVHGVNDLFTYTQVIADNFLMFVFGPTLFWHRAGNLVMSLCSLLAIYTFFSLSLASPWPLAIVAATAATFHWQIFSRISFNHIDSFIYAYTALTAFTLILRDPARQSRWLALGIVAGLSLFFTQTAWAEVAACGLVLGVWALVNRRFVPLAICGVSFLIAGLPVLIQFRGLLHSATVQSRMILEWNYLAKIFRAILWLPVGRDLRAVEWNGAFAAWPCGYLYLAGLVIAAACIVPPVRRRLRLPLAVVGLLLLFFAEVGLMTLTNNANANPSPKRTYHLIPLQVFFGLLPFYTLAQAARASALAYRAVTAVAFGAVAAYAFASATLFVHPEQFGFGGNIFDGIVQMHQRFPDRKVLVFTPQVNVKDDVDDPHTLLNEGYHVAENVAVTPTIDAGLVSAACAARTILCYHGKPENRAQFESAAAEQRLRKVEVYAVSELLCAECV